MKKKHQGVFNNKVLLYFSKKDKKKGGVNNFVAKNHSFRADLLFI